MPPPLPLAVDVGKYAAMVRSLLHYDADTGTFTWKRTAYGATAGEEAGCVSGKYRRIAVGGQRHMAHRLAWLYMTSEWPEADIDHIDGNGFNNRFSNLRKASRAQNCANSRRSKNNRSGFKCVCFHRGSGKFRASITVNRKQFYLGQSDTAEGAYALYVAAAPKFHGEFARCE